MVITTIINWFVYEDIKNDESTENNEEMKNMPPTKNETNN